MELLIEGIDNARNIENMKLWPAIIKQLDHEAPEIRKGTAWVCGTAVQNNPEAQKAVSKHILRGCTILVLTSFLFYDSFWRIKV